VLLICNFKAIAQEYVFPPLDEAEALGLDSKSPQYIPLEKGKEYPSSDSYYQKPAYRFPPLETDPQSNTFSQQPMFPPREQNKEEYDPYAYSYDEGYREGYSPSVNKKPGKYPRKAYKKKTYNSHRRGYKRNTYYEPYNYMTMPFDGLFPGGNYGSSPWSPFSGGFNSMPFYNNRNSTDILNKGLPGFFSR